MTQPRDERVHPTEDDRLVTALSESVGGPVGSRAARHPWWTPVRVVLAVTAVCFALGLLQKTNCYNDAWRDTESRYTHMCYSDLPYLYTGRGFVELTWPYSSDPQVRARYEVMEYPAVISYYAFGAAWVTQLLSGSPDLRARYLQPVDQVSADPVVITETKLFVVVNAAGFAALALLAAWLISRTNRRRPWDAMLFAASPLLALTATVNWDLLVVALTAAALYAWSRGHPTITGILIGVGTATKLFPLFLLGGILIICLRQRRVADLLATAGAASTGWVMANLPAYATGPEQWQRFWQFNSERGADLGSVWIVIEQAFDHDFAAGTINNVSWVFLIAWCLGVLAIGLKAPKTPRLAQLGLLVVIGFLLINKVYSPQYVLWLLPLAVLARPRLRDHVVWQSTEVLYFASVWWYLGGQLNPAGGSDAGFYWVAVVVRMLGELYLAGIVVRDILRPEHDPVDRDEPEDLRDDDEDATERAEPAEPAPVS